VSVDGYSPDQHEREDVTLMDFHGPSGGPWWFRRVRGVPIQVGIYLFEIYFLREKFQ